MLRKINRMQRKLVQGYNNWIIRMKYKDLRVSKKKIDYLH